MDRFVDWNQQASTGSEKLLHQSTSLEAWLGDDVVGVATIWEGNIP
jgi:hypothetical protein